jgi:hypothetical protein
VLDPDVFFSPLLILESFRPLPPLSVLCVGQPTPKPSVPPSHMPTHKPSVAPTAMDTAAVAVEFTLSSTLTPNNERKAQLKATVEERVAADLGLASVAVENFDVAYVIAGARRLGLGASTPARKLVAYDWTASFTVKAPLSAAGLADSSELVGSVVATLTSSAFVSQALSRAKADVDTASVASGVSVALRPGSTPSPSTAPAPPTPSPVASAPTPPTSPTPATTPATEASSKSKSKGNSSGSTDAASLGILIAGVVVVLVAIGCGVRKVRQYQASKALDAKAMDEAYDRVGGEFETDLDAPKSRKVKPPMKPTIGGSSHDFRNLPQSNIQMAPTRAVEL